MKQRFLIPLTALLLVGCATKTDPCGDGMARADDGNCYPLSGAADDTGTNNQSNNQLPDSDADADADNDGGPPPDDGGDDGGPPPDDGGDDGGPPPDDGGDDGGPPPDDGAGTDTDGGPPPDDGGDFDGGPPPDDGGDFDGGPPPDEGGDFDGGAPPDDGGGPGTCEADEDCTDRCFDEGYDCVCDPAPQACVPACNAASECPEPFTCDTSAVSASGRSGICTPGMGGGPPGGM